MVRYHGNTLAPGLVCYEPNISIEYLENESRSFKKETLKQTKVTFFTFFYRHLKGVTSDEMEMFLAPGLVMGQTPNAPRTYAYFPRQIIIFPVDLRPISINKDIVTTLYHA